MISWKYTFRQGHTYAVMKVDRPEIVKMFLGMDNNFRGKILNLIATPCTAFFGSSEIGTGYTRTVLFK